MASKTQNQKASGLEKILAGGAAGASETFVTYPTEFLKTRRQLPEARNSSFMSIARATYAKDGFRGFYAGCGALALSNTFKAGIRFFTFEAARDILDASMSKTSTGQRNPLVNVFAGLAAGTTESILVVTPGEALKTRIVQDRILGQPQGLVATASTIFRSEGITAFWRGVGPVVGKQATNSAVRFSTYGFLEETLRDKFTNGKNNSAVTFLAGAMSGVVTVYASMPFDNIKTRMQGKGHNYTGMFNCATRTFVEEGVLAFWRGTTPRLIRLTFSSAITFTVYNKVIALMSELKTKPLQGQLA